MYVRQMHFRKSGDIELGHAHEYGHLTLLAKGVLDVEANDKVTEYVAPTMIYIKADIFHKLTARSDETVAYCIHPLRGDDKTDDILDPAMVPNGVEVLPLIYSLISEHHPSSGMAKIPTPKQKRNSVVAPSEA
jgi:hypothetical protein